MESKPLRSLFFILFIALLSTSVARAQDGWTIGASVGAVNYFGDVSDNESFSFDGINVGGALSLEKRFGGIFVPQLQVLGTQINSQKTYLDVEMEGLQIETSLKLGLDLVGFVNKEAKLEVIPSLSLLGSYYSSSVSRISTGEEISDIDRLNQGETFGFGFGGGARLGYKFTPSWRLFTGMDIKYYLSDQVDSYTGTTDFNDMFSYVYLGVGYTFKPKVEDEIFEEPEPIIAEVDSNEIVTGQFSYNGQPKSGVKLDLYDANENKMASTITDIEGNFKFKELDPESDYLVKLSEEDKGLFNGGKLYATNDDGKRVAMAGKPEYNTYSFTQLTREEWNNKPVLVEEKPVTAMEGAFVYEELPAAGVKLYLVDDEGNRIDSTVTRNDGTFKFGKLNPDEAYMVRMSEKDAEKYDGAEMYFVNKDKDPVIKAGKMEDGAYTFNAMVPKDVATLEPLTADNGEMLYRRTTVQEPPKVDLGVDEEKKDDVAASEDKRKELKEKSEPKAKGDYSSISFEKETIYFRHNSFWVSQNQSGTKGSIIANKLKDNPGMRIKIEGWASPPGADDYNLRLSQKRADALKELLVKTYSIESSRIEAVGMGEVQDPEMSDEEARRAKIKVIN